VAPPRREATFEAAPNIALIKYWGMRDVARGLPYNSSFSVTLDRLRTRTTVRWDPTLPSDRFVLNRAPVAGPAADAVSRFLDLVRAMAKVTDPAQVVSTNNFPEASGLASSASGFAALAGAATASAGLRLSGRDLSRLARLGSGSASRSIFGGFVEWRAGRRPDGRDCYAVPALRASHWPELVDLVLLVGGAPKKEVRSALAMQTTVTTSPAYRARLAAVPKRLARLRSALRRRDPRAFFPLVIEECDEFRHVCETTDPPLDYLTSTSRETLAAIRAFNDARAEPRAAYTHDAGAHVHVFTLRRHERALREKLEAVRGIERILRLRPGPGARRLARAGQA
jgi:diphosphomevalonate decarboxylase